MRYEHPRAIPRAEVEQLLAGSVDEIAQALLGISFFEADRAWVFERLQAVAAHPEAAVRGLVATCVGHIARIDRGIDLARAGPLLDRLATDPEIAGRVADAWEDIERFASGRRR
jgi:hypothetical protein